MLLYQFHCKLVEVELPDQCAECGRSFTGDEAEVAATYLDECGERIAVGPRSVEHTAEHTYDGNRYLIMLQCPCGHILAGDMP
ncbi:MAG: hypothetical protein KJO40_13650 [Deltaproteobacteria bacterium]|nr:hypothetical protein [Deltaproteobacteria bacterium]